MDTGVSTHYQGDLGADYYEWQKEIGALGGFLNARKFESLVKPEDTVVDFGCGGGYLLANLDAKEKIGIEPNPTARDEANARGIKCVAAPEEIPAGTADIIVSNHALEHVLNPHGELSNLREALKPGGRLAICIPMDRSKRAFDGTYDINHHLYGWTPLLLANLVGEAGFEVAEAKVLRHAWPPRAHIFARLPRPVFDLLSRMRSLLTGRCQVTLLAIRPND